MIQWHATLETGHALVDSDHRQLISTLNELEQALKQGVGKDELARIITFLVVYANAHFAREEQHMREVQCPSLLPNCLAHSALRRKLDSWMETMGRSGPSTTLVLEIYREMSSWITQHIRKVDCQLRGCRA
jgi:hemerythrin